MGYHSECAGKLSFPDRVSATKAMRRAQEKGRDMNAYCCKYCRLFHIGNRTNKKQKEIVDKYFREQNKRLKTF